MNSQLNQLKQMGRRIRENRLILEISVEEMAQVTGVSPAEYLAHEEGTVDSSFSFLYHCAERFGVDIRALVTGEAPKLSFYALTRNGSGMRIKRRQEFEYRHLAPNLKNRQAEPFVVKALYQDPALPITRTTHSGEEFDYVLKGRLRIQLGDKIELLNAGDSVFYDSGRPHGMVAADPEGCEFLSIVIRGNGEEPSPFTPNEVRTTVLPTMRHLIYHDFVDETLDENGLLKDAKIHYPENYNFAYDVVDALAERQPDKRALLWLSRTRERRDFTFADISRESLRTANYLYSLGIRKGDRVMLVLKRHYQFWLAMTALHRIGAVAIPASNLLLTKDFEYRFQRVGVKAILCSGDGDIAGYAEEASRTCPDLKIKIIVNGQKAGWHDFNAEYPAFPAEFPRPADLRATDPAVMFFSSGTTGYPKAVVHSHTYSLGHAITARWWHHADPEGVHLTISDTGWGKALWGKYYGQWLSECTVLAYDFDRFDAADILTLFKEYHITTFCAPPTMYRFFIREDLSKYDLSELKYATIAGEALNPEVFQQFYKATGLKLMEGFGQTETTLVIGNLIGMTPKPGSMGKPTPLYQVELVDPDGRPVKSGETGEIVIKTERNQIPGVFLEYYDNPEATSESWHDGWYHTGDTAWRDEDGYYWYVGRIDDLIKSSGYRIGPFEIESIIMELPYVLECAVVGTPDPIRGQIVKAFIVLTKGKEGSEELKKEIQEYVKHHTAPYKYPRSIEFIDAMPKTVSGKIRRTELRKM